MDVYSFGLLMWELYHEHVPFDGDLKACTDYVLKDERPMIETTEEVEEDEDEDEDDEEIKDPERTQTLHLTCSAPIAALIRLCWQSDPAQRPSYSYILEHLYKEKTFYSSRETEYLSDHSCGSDSLSVSGESINL